MKKAFYILWIVAALLSLGFGVITGSAQEDPADEQFACEDEIANVMDAVEQYCAGLGRDQVCYGNIEVNAIPRQAQIQLNFNRPGDSADVSLIRSLYLSALNSAEKSWGIAQMRLLANLSQQSPQEVFVLLFGDVSIEDAYVDRVSLDVPVGQTFAARIRNLPSLNSLVIDVAEPGEMVHALGRLEDSSWVRIEENDMGRVGWVATELLNIDEADLESLPVDEADSPYFGAMQAFYFQSGSSATCSNTISDGMLIQTPEGVARMTMLINEVSIELLGAGGFGGSTALVEASPGSGMNLSMLNGAAQVTVGNQTVYVDTNRSVQIPLDQNLSPIGSISSASSQQYDSGLFNRVALTSLIDGFVTSVYPSSDDSLTSADTEELEDDTILSDTSGTSGSAWATGGTMTGTSGDDGRDGEFGCEKKGNACNAPGHTEDNANDASPANP
jgi:hypothetical protein